MKRIIIFSLFWLCGMQALLAQDVIITRQSERIDAKILEVSETEIRYKKQNNPDGPTFVISTDKVSSILFSNGEVQSYTQTKQTSPKSSPQNAATAFTHNKGWEFSVNPLLSVNLGSGGGANFQATLGTGRHVADNFFLGFNAGGIFGTVSSFTFGTTARAYFPLNNSTMDFFVELYVGAQTDFDNWGFTPHLIPGMQIPLSKSIDFRFGVGYKGIFIEGASASALALGTSFAFHPANKSMTSISHPSSDGFVPEETAIETPKPVKPTLEKGLLLSGGLHAINPLGFTFAAGYKINKKLSVSLGFSAELESSSYSNENVRMKHRVSSTSSTWSETIYQTQNLGFEDGPRFFVRGNYRLTENTISPFVSADLGLKKIHCEYEHTSLYPTYNNSSYYSIWISPFDISYSPFIAPAIGLSWKVGSNSFLELKCVYDMTLAIVSTNITERYYYSPIGDVNVKSTYSGTSFLSHFFVGLEFNHTLEIDKVKNFFGID